VTGQAPPDPFRQVDVLAALVAEQYAAFVKAGIPAAQVSVILGTMLSGLLSADAQGADSA
jgi:hypothetical protein